MDTEEGPVIGDKVNIGMDLLFIHMREGGEELLEVLRGCRIAVGHFGSVYEGHVDSPVPMPAAVVAGDLARGKGKI